MRAALSVAVFVVLAACATSSPDTGQVGGDPDRLTREQIMESGFSSLHEVVSRLRPRWLRSFGTTLVYLDDVPMGNSNALRDWPPTTAYLMEWLAPLQARTRVPNIGLEEDIGGVIFVSTRPGGGG